MTRIVPSLKIAGDIDANNNSITNLSVPISSSDAVSKSYVDARPGIPGATGPTGPIGLQGYTGATGPTGPSS